MTNKGLSRFIPAALLDAYKPALADGWETGCFMFMVAAWLAVIANFIVDFSVSFDTGFQGLWEADTLFVAVPVVIIAFTLVVRTQASNSSARGLWLLDGALTLTCAFGALTAVAGAIGIFTSFANNGFGFVLGAIVFHVGDIALGAVVVGWSLNELAAVRKFTPVTTTSLSTSVPAAASWGAPAPAPAPAPGGASGVATSPPAPGEAPGGMAPPPPQ